MLSRQLKLFREVQSFRLLALATVGSAFGTWIAFIALAVDVYNRTGSATWVSALLIADFLPAILIGFFAGTLVDRLPRRRLMVLSDVVRFAVFAVLPFANDDPAGIVALAAVAGFATGFFRPAMYAGLPNLVSDDDLPQANSLLQTIENVALAAGPIVAAGLLKATGPDIAYGINALTFLASAALLVRIPAGLLQAAPAAGHGYWRDLMDGFRLVRDSRALLTVFVVWNLVMFGVAGVNVAEVALAERTFGAEDYGYGLLVGATGIGLAVGSVGAGLLLENRVLGRVYGAAIAVIAGGVLAAAASPSIWVAAAFVAIYGIGNGIAVVCNSLFVQRGAPDEFRGRAFTVLMSSNYVVLGLGMVAAGPLTDEVGARWVWALAGFFIAVAALVAPLLAPRVAGDEVAEPVLPAPAPRGGRVG